MDWMDKLLYPLQWVVAWILADLPRDLHGDRPAGRG